MHSLANKGCISLDPPCQYFENVYSKFWNARGVDLLTFISDSWVNVGDVSLASRMHMIELLEVCQQSWIAEIVKNCSVGEGFLRDRPQTHF